KTIERMEPAQYLASSYYERWLHAQTQNLIAAGVLTQAELADRLAYFRAHPQATPPQRNDPELVQSLLAGALAPESHRIEADVQPAFNVGDTIRARNIHPAGHTRLPRYVRGRRAVITHYHGVQDFSDNWVPGVAAGPQPLYTVRFEASELWGESAEPNSAVYL